MPDVSPLSRVRREDNLGSGGKFVIVKCPPHDNDHPLRITVSPMNEYKCWRKDKSCALSFRAGSLHFSDFHTWRITNRRMPSRDLLDW